MIKVVNKYHGEKGEYIGRPSILSNPFKIGIDGDRGEVIRKYRDYFYDRVQKNDQDFLEELRKLYTIAKKQDLNLVCFCSPKPCHGDVIKEFLDRYLN